MRASTRTDVIVVGAGIVGASVAFHAARGGAAVVLVDRSRPASGVTGDSFAWIGGAPDAAVQWQHSTARGRAGRLGTTRARCAEDHGVPDGVAVVGAAGVSDVNQPGI
jgi:glycine/D-amino acid oxidase-like deaminating enzyme